MKIVRVKYTQALPLREDFLRAFPDWDGTRADISDAIGNRHVHIKEFRDQDGIRTHIIVYMLVRDAFQLPAWVQGIELSPTDVNHPIDHYFMGHENPVPDEN